MQIEVDQSGIIGRTNIDTVFAFSNAINRSLLIPANVKRECLKVLRPRGKPGGVYYFRLFAAALFLLLKDHLDQVSLIIIDVEFEGKETEIKGMLLNHIRKVHPSFPGNGITFARIGKRSRAHKKAIETFRGTLLADKTVSADELLDLLK